MENLVGKTINLQLVGLDGNAFVLMGAFQRQARRERWSQEEIKTVLDEAMTGDYNHLLMVLDIHCQPEEDLRRRLLIHNPFSNQNILL